MCMNKSHKLPTYKSNTLLYLWYRYVQSYNCKKLRNITTNVNIMFKHRTFSSMVDMWHLHTTSHQMMALCWPTIFIFVANIVKLNVAAVRLNSIHSPVSHIWNSMPVSCTFCVYLKGMQSLGIMRVFVAVVPCIIFSVSLLSCFRDGGHSRCTNKKQYLHDSKRIKESARVNRDPYMHHMMIPRTQRQKEQASNEN